jgi:hypothetical protein
VKTVENDARSEWECTVLHLEGQQLRAHLVRVSLVAEPCQPLPPRDKPEQLAQDAARRCDYSLFVFAEVTADSAILDEEPTAEELYLHVVDIAMVETTKIIIPLKLSSAMNAKTAANPTMLYIG